MKKVLVIGDSPSTPTGFSNVIFNIFSRFNQEEFEIVQLGVNYYGDPHKIPWGIYPAVTGGDIWGFNRLPGILQIEKPDLIFILNDLWVIDKHLDIIKNMEDYKIPPVVIYYPVDSRAYQEDWFRHFDIVSQAVVYTKFGLEVSKRVAPKIDFKIIPHGVDTKVFHKLNVDKRELKRVMLPNAEEFLDSFIVLNANRNQPRKRIDLTIAGFSLFAKDKPKNVKLYLHMGLKDAGIDISKTAKWYGVDDRLIVSNKNMGIQSVSLEMLNKIYNISDIGINTSQGEGWGLVSVEHTVTGAPQIVPEHSACTEIFSDCGLVIPAPNEIVNSDISTVARTTTPEYVAQALQDLYTNQELYNSLSARAVDKFTSDDYSWDSVSLKFRRVLRGVL